MKMPVLVVTITLFSLALPAFAQGGCVNSPENPTALLAVVGSAASVAMIIRGRRGRK